MGDEIGAAASMGVNLTLVHSWTRACLRAGMLSEDGRYNILQPVVTKALWLVHYSQHMPFLLTCCNSHSSTLTFGVLTLVCHRHPSSLHIPPSALAKGDVGGLCEQ